MAYHGTVFFNTTSEHPYDAIVHSICCFLLLPYRSLISTSAPALVLGLYLLFFDDVILLPGALQCDFVTYSWINRMPQTHRVIFIHDCFNNSPFGYLVLFPLKVLSSVIGSSRCISWYNLIILFGVLN